MGLPWMGKFHRGNMDKKFQFLIFFVILVLFFPSIIEAEGASLYFSPQSGTFYVGSTFNVSIFVNTGGNDVNAVKVDLKFDPRRLQIVSPTVGRSFITVWVSHPTYSNIEGTASFQGGMPSPGINTSAGLVSTITFRAIAPGEAVIYFLDSSKVLLDDGKGTNILTSLGKGIYTITIPPPEGPKIFSTTHPDQNKWYNNNSPTFSWDKEEGVTDFSYSLDRSYYGVPDDISEGDHISVSFANLEDGIWYFHLKAKKGEVWGGVSHYVVQIDATPPAAFKLIFEPVLRSPVVTVREPIVSFLTTDNLSGIDHYELKLVDLTGSLAKLGREITGFFIEVTSPYRLPTLKKGEYEVIVRAFDVAGNWQDTSQKIEVVPIEKPFYITKRGVGIFNFFISWWQIILIELIPFTFLLLIVIFWWWLRRKRLYKRREDLAKIRERIERNGKEIKEKLNGLPLP